MRAQRGKESKEQQHCFAGTIKSSQCEFYPFTLSCPDAKGVWRKEGYNLALSIDCQKGKSDLQLSIGLRLAKMCCSRVETT